ncbi:MAG TPA: hypothetical protein VH583_20345 [Vicinamibacterales bacterium]|jgi:hypothetical protein
MKNSDRETLARTAHLQVFESDGQRALVELRRLQIRLVEPRPESAGLGK